MARRLQRGLSAPRWFSTSSSPVVTTYAEARLRLVEWGTKELSSIRQVPSAKTDTDAGGMPEVRNVARLESELFYNHAQSSTSGPSEVENLFRSCVERRKRGEPTAYITGRKQFWGYDFAVSPATLIPRPDTEIIIDAALSLYEKKNKPQHILDLGTGSGCILLSLLSEFKAAHGVGVDKSIEALKIAAINAHRMKLADRTRLIASDWLSNIEEINQFDLVLSNPPYIPHADLATLDRDVRDFEPVTALDGGADGLQVYRHLAQSLKLERVMAPGAFLLLEVGIGQAAQVVELFRPKLQCVEVRRDLADIPRCLVMQRPNGA